MKKFLATLFLGMALMGAALPSWAAQGTVTLTPQGDQAKVTLSLPDQADQSAATLQLAFQVEGGDAGAEFLFDKGLTCPVQEYLYEESTGRLTVYLAGDQPLFQSGSLELGSIRLKAQKGAAATVRVVEDSLELVNAAYGKDQATAAVSGGEVTLTVGGAGSTSQPGQNSGSGQSGPQDAGPVPAVEQPAAALQPTAGSQETTGKPGTTAAPTQSPEPTGEPAEEEPLQPVQESQPTATPEEAGPAPGEKSGPSPLLLLGGGAAVILLGGLAVYLRRR